MTDLIIIVVAVILGFSGRKFERAPHRVRHSVLSAEDTPALNIISLILSIIFMLDVIFRVVAQG